MSHIADLALACLIANSFVLLPTGIEGGFVYGSPAEAQISRNLPSRESSEIRYSVVILQDRWGNKHMAAELRIPKRLLSWNSTTPPVRNGLILSMNCRQLLSEYAPSQHSSNDMNCDYPVTPAGYGKYPWRLEIENRASNPLDLTKAAAIKRRFEQNYITGMLSGSDLLGFSSGYSFSNKGSNGQVLVYQRQSSHGQTDALLVCYRDRPNPSCQETFDALPTSHITVQYQFPMRLLGDWPRIRRAVVGLISSIYVQQVAEPR